MSLRARLLAGMAFVALVLVIVSVIITLTTRGQLIDQVDARLSSLSPNDRERSFPDDGVSFPPPSPPADVVVERVSDVYQGIVSADGRLQTRFTPNLGGSAYAAPAIDVGDLPAAGSKLFTTEAENGDVTYRVLAQRAGDLIAITALPIDDVETTISRLVWVVLFGSLAILAALAVVGWWVVHLGIRPVKEMTQTATRIADGDLAVRVPESSPSTESGALAIALNRMLGHIEHALGERASSEDRLRRFVADASHELRTPLTTIRGYAELYRMGGLRDQDTLDDAMRRTEQEATRMGRLVEDMLLLAKLDEERPLESRPVDLAVLAHDAVADARAAAPLRTIELDSCQSPAIVLGDEDRLRQVFANVVANAVVHTDPSVPVVIRVARTQDSVTFEVEDRGPGMTAEVLERVTERFFRADPARSRHRGGSGLGLSIVQAAVSAHGGSVEIDSAPGAGTTVRLVIPAPAPAPSVGN